MAFWRFGFHSQSAIDSILSSSTAHHHGQNTGGFSTPSTSSPSLLLDKLLEEDDLLQEIKAQHPKLVEFLGTREVVGRMLGYISGMIFDDEDDEREAEASHSGVDRLTIHPTTATTDASHSGSPSTSTGGTFLSSFRTRSMGDTIGALLMDALDSEGRTPEDRAKAERRKVRFPYLCAEILASELWTVTSQIFNDAPRFGLLTRFWDAVLDQPPSATALKTVQIGYWAKTNIALINSKPKEMISFIKSYPNVIPKLLAHFDASPLVDVMMRIIQCEETSEGIIDWLIDSTDFIELTISLLHPSRNSELHLTTAEFLKNVIAYCTSHVALAQTPPGLVHKVASSGSPPGSGEGLTTNSPDPTRPSLGSTSQPSPPNSALDEKLNMITARLMRALSSRPVISRLLSYGIDTQTSEDDTVITNATLTSSLVNSLSVIIDIIRRNNSDYSEHQLMVHLRNQFKLPIVPADNSAEPKTPISDSAPRVVPLTDLLDAIGDRLVDLQKLIKSPRSSTRPMQMVFGQIIPLSVERFRIIELYAELLHCSNMGLVNRRPTDNAPCYNEDGALVSGLEHLIAIFGGVECEQATSEQEQLSDQPLSGSKLDETKALELAALAGQSKGVAEIHKSATMQEESGALADCGIDSAPAILPQSESPDDSKPPGGVRLKELFIEHKILDTCFELFFQFPWNNFLHNVVYDIVQQILNAKFEAAGGESSLRLARSLFESTGVIEKILEGVELDQVYRKAHKNVGLGNMAHLILIGDEIWKTLENNRELFGDLYQKWVLDPKWSEFTAHQILEARKHAGSPLGGTMPVVGTINIQTTDLANSSLKSNRGSKWKKEDESKGEGFARYLVEQISLDGTDKYTSSSDEDDSDEEEEASTSRAGSYDLTDDWDQSRIDGGSSRTRFGSGGGIGASVISNPKSFGLDDQPDNLALPHRFPGSSTSTSGFDDNFGPFNDDHLECAETPKPSRPVNVEQSKETRQEEEEDWGEFSSSMIGQDESEESWSDFDLQVDQQPTITERNKT